MPKPKFKDAKRTNFVVGDKVKLVGDVFWVDRYYTNKVGIVIEVVINGPYPYIVGVDTVKIPVNKIEIEKVIIKGQQLLFNFMN